jgi:hypothetical protein
MASQVWLNFKSSYDGGEFVTAHVGDKEPPSYNTYRDKDGVKQEGVWYRYMPYSKLLDSPVAVDKPADDTLVTQSTRFKYLGFNDLSKARIEAAQALCIQLEKIIDDLPCGAAPREIWFAMAKLEECFGWIGKAVKVCQEKGK